MANLDNTKIAVIGLGYVGLPLAVEFGKHFPTLGFDIDATRIAELAQGVDRTRELDAGEIAEASQLRYSAAVEELLGQAGIAPEVGGSSMTVRLPVRPTALGDLAESAAREEGAA